MDALELSFHLYKKHWETMHQQAASGLPEEVCGVVAGQEGYSIEVFPVTNAMHSPVRFLMEPLEQVNALINIEKNNWELAAIYHSHPNGPPVPSPTDIAESNYPGVINLIWTRQGEEWSCRGFIIEDRKVTEVLIIVENE